MKHKLIKYTDDSQVVTGQELKDYLVSIGFNIASIAPVINFNRPPTPTVQKIVVTGTSAAMHPEWVAYYQAFADFKQAKAMDEARYMMEMKAAVQYLEMTFDGIISYVRTGATNPNGTDIWAWLPSTAYDYEKCAMKLTGAKRPENIIDFICFQNFGS